MSRDNPECQEEYEYYNCPEHNDDEPTDDEIEFTKEWFRNEDNQVSEKDLKIGDHFLLDLYPVYDNGINREQTDVEIWEVVVTKGKHYHKIRNQWFNFQAIRKVTTGKQFDYPNGYWKVK